MTTTALPWRSAARTETGKVRSKNEDALLAKPEQGLWVVADGMGGHQNGALASRLIVESLAELPGEGSLETRLQQLRQCLQQINLHLGRDLTLCATPRNNNIIGSTVVALLAEGNRAVCVWAGDSRCYLWRGRRLYQISRDHSFAQHLIDELRLTPAEAGRHPSAHALTQAVGASEELTLDVLHLNLHPGDAFLLCSDGLYRSLSPDALGLALSQNSPEAALHSLFEQALSGPARDNLSAVVVRR
jgi:serine/threonine-protein phosphatase Stp1